MKHLESQSTDPALNLALEQYVFDTLSRGEDFFMLWQNRDSVIVGLHQNTAEEVSRAYVDRYGIPVLRRLSGGGAVFHDLGNINFSFITSVPDAGRLDHRSSCKPVMEALEELGIRIETSGRNDMRVNGKKFSGSARYLRSGRLMHHGTILFDSDLEKMTEVLRVPQDEIFSKSIKSVREPVINLRGCLPVDMTTREFREYLGKSIAANRNMSSYALTEQDWHSVEEIRRQRYDDWEWNYGRSPGYRIIKHRRLPGFGEIRTAMQVDGGRIISFAAEDDCFRRLPDLLRNTRLDKNALRQALAGDAYPGISLDELIGVILE